MQLVTRKSQKGFTLIEMIVSLGVFSVVITIAVGALLGLISANEQLQAEQSVMTNLSFALDSMTREIRTGTNYFCDEANNYSAGGPNNIFDDGNNIDSIIGNSVDDCDGRSNSNRKLHGLSFRETGNSITTGSNDRILYFHDSDSGSVNYGKIMRKVGDGPAQSIVSEGIFISDAEFFVTGSEKLSSGSGAGYEDQASVTIFIEAYDTSDASGKPYRVQTTVTQRTLDI
ncbi:prepilin-type N-terminal cleavage/methylation domain-containing protein [Candidatus Kaiserbacteria bacterium]|nr:prepilin-type N-terminal cleavage/methylation domain-containing protein [Candidatus Kaiserbacteria bacterium]